jgi:FtsH-binding integral membrane protein
MIEFTFTLKDNNQKAFNSFFWFLLFLHVIAASVVILNVADTPQKIIAAVVMAAYFILTAAFFLLKNKFKLSLYQLIVFGLMVVFWLAQTAWLPAVICIAAIVFGYKILQTKSMIVFSKENITVKKSLFKKVHNWATIENVVLKDGLLSIDFKNNQLMQVEIAGESSAVDEKVFNSFCSQQQTTNDKPQTL